MNTKTKIWLPLIIAMALLVGYALRYLSDSPQEKYTLFPQNVSVSGKLDAVMQRLKDAYYKPVATDSLEEVLIHDMLKDLDPHTVYISAKHMKSVREDIQGHFSGIGVQFIEYEDTVMVVRAIPDGPSQRAGVLAGDRIVTVDGDTIAGRDDIGTDSIMRKLKGVAGSLVSLGIKRIPKEELIPIEVTRGDVNVATVDIAYMLDKVTGFIKVNQFGQRTYHEFLAGLHKLREQGMERLVVDLRSNQGGLLDVCVAIVNEFLDKGDLIVYTEGLNSPRIDKRANGRGEFKDIPLVVLIDSYSASASEIFAGAVQDHDRGVIVGRRSFGKGLVQEQMEYADGSALRLTVAEYFTPSGRNIQKPFDVKDKTSYENDINERYEHGEFSVADSTHFADSLKYKTASGRIVYGGGGVMPDVFVPLDTTVYSNYFELLQRKALVRDFAYKFTDIHRSELLGMKDYKEMQEYIKKTDYMQEFVRFATKKGVPKDAKGYAASSSLLENQITALIVRNVIDDEGFYPILHQNDIILKQGIGTFIKEYKELQSKKSNAVE